MLFRSLSTLGNKSPGSRDTTDVHHRSQTIGTLLPTSESFRATIWSDQTISEQAHEPGRSPGRHVVAGTGTCVHGDELYRHGEFEMADTVGEVDRYHTGYQRHPVLPLVRARILQAN